MKISALDTEVPEANISLLCTPTESYDISTWEEFTSKFMVRKNLKTIFFCYNLRYDSQAILKLLPYDVLIQLWKEKKIEYEGYRILYIPKKMLQISEIKNKGGAIHLYDASQYYGYKSLDSMSEKYLGEKKLDTISGKEIGESREYYQENYDEIVKYCKRDAKLTLELGLLAMKNIEELGFDTSNPISPASISAKYQRKRGYPDRIPDMKNKERQANNIAFYAYRGGIFATYKRGYFKDGLYDYDVNSCYPNVMISLPDWRNGEFVDIVKNPENFKYGWILVDVNSEYIPYREDEHYEVKEIYEDIGEWDMKYKAKKVTYPTGWRTEVITTVEFRWLKEHKEKVKWLGEGIGWKQTNSNYENPFAWMREMFERRKELKKTNPSLAQTIKILMNSLYGKTVERSHGIGILTNFCYGSYITAEARLQMFDVVKENYDIVVNVATDGILTTEKLPEKEGFVIGDNLGEWEYTEYSKGIIVGNGIRQLWKEDGTFETHARGITSDRSYDLKTQMKNEMEIPVGRVRVIQLGTMVNAHIKWKKDDLNRFVLQQRVLKVNTDKKRRWDRDYTSFKDLLESEPMGSLPLRVDI